MDDIFVDWIFNVCKILVECIVGELKLVGFVELWYLDDFNVSVNFVDNFFFVVFFDLEIIMEEVLDFKDVKVFFVLIGFDKKF